MYLKLSLKDISLMPADLSDVVSRTEECNPYDEKGKLPIFVAPMNNIVNLSNFETFENEKLYVIVPITESMEDRIDSLTKGRWVAFSLKESEKLSEKLSPDGSYKICIDTANGHMKRLLEVVSSLKDSLPNSEIMTGNIANPSAYEHYARAGVDYIRLGIGAGSQCTTSVNTGIHYPLASLIQECSQRRSTILTHSNKSYRSIPKLVADGGISTFGDICKCLALGADYVMLGRMVVACKESAAKEVNHPFSSIAGEGGYKEYYGMSTEKSQKERGRDNISTSEGIESVIKIDYTLKEFVTKAGDYIKSSMSYCGYFDLKNFIGKPRPIQITENAYQVYSDK